MDKKYTQFWLKLTAYVLPFSIGFFALTASLVYIGESTPLGMVARYQQQNDTVLYRYRYGNRDQQFKALSVNLRRPDVLALGSSRILQFRAGFFNRDPQAFYNAAAPAWGLAQVARLLHSLDEEALPRILILSIDPPWFNPAYEMDVFPDDVTDFENIFLVNRSFLQEVINGVSFERSGFRNAQYVARAEPGGSGGLALGMRAIRDGHGFRSDGSEQYGDFLIAGWLHQPQQRANHLRMMYEGQEMYVYGDTLSEEALIELSAILQFAAQHDIYVIGFLPPYAPGLWSQMTARGNHTYITALTPRLQTMFDAYDFPFFDFSNGEWAGIRDEEFFDGWHASELGNLRIYLHMLDALPDILGVYSDGEGLRQIAENAGNTWDVFGMGNTPR